MCTTSSRGSYLAYTKPKLSGHAKLMFWFSLFDKEMRRTLRRFAASSFRNPSSLFKKLYVQTISVRPTCWTFFRPARKTIAMDAPT